MNSKQWFVVGLALASVTGAGCFALDWDFAGKAEGGGGMGGAGASGNGGSTTIGSSSSSGNAVSSSSSSSGSSSSSSSSSSSGAPPTEDCVNKVDDDLDGKVDCGDGDCGLYECKVAIPPGWEPFWVLETSYEDPQPTVCPGGEAATRRFVAPETSTSCTQCSCSYAGAACSAPAFSCAYYDDTCTNWSMPAHQATTTACYALPNIPNAGMSAGGCKLTGESKVVNKGSCTGGPSMKAGPPMFGKELRLCSAPPGQGDGCSVGDACTLKKPGVLSKARTCIAQPGTTSCPMGWDNAVFAAYEGGTDTRACSNCVCNTDTVTCSGGKVRLFDESGCGLLSVELVDQTCVQESFYFQHSANFVLGTPSQGTCMQATPSGSVQTTGPHTVCCRE